MVSIDALGGSVDAGTEQPSTWIFPRSSLTSKLLNEFLVETGYDMVRVKDGAASGLVSKLFVPPVGFLGHLAA